MKHRAILSDSAQLGFRSLAVCLCGTPASPALKRKLAGAAAIPPEGSSGNRLASQGRLGLE